MNGRKPVRGRARATNLVEFALVLPAFLVLTLGFVQVSIWALCVTLANLAASDAAHAAAGLYLAQYEAHGSWVQASYPGTRASWAPAFGEGLLQGNAIFNLLRITSQGSPSVMVFLDEQDLAPGHEGTRLIRADVSVTVPRLSPFVPRPPGLAPYLATATTRPTRFYSY